MGIFRKIGEKLVGTEDLVIWDRSEAEDTPQRGLVYRVPNAEISDMRRVEKFGCRDYERLLLYQSGQLMSVLEGGVYELEKDHRNKATELVWVDVGIVEIPWGVPYFQSMIMTTEMIKVGMNGSMKVRVAEPSSFIQKVVAYKKDFSDKTTKQFITNLFIVSLRDIVKKYNLRNLVTSNKDDINNLTVTTVSKEFKLYGLELISNNIVGFAFDPKDQPTVDSIIDETKGELSKLQEEKADAEATIKRMENQLIELEDQYAEGTIDDEEFDTKEGRIKKILNRRKTSLAEIQGKIDAITKEAGIQN